MPQEVGVKLLRWERDANAVLIRRSLLVFVSDNPIAISFVRLLRALAS